MAGRGGIPALLVAVLALCAPVGAVLADPLTTSLRPKLRPLPPVGAMGVATNMAGPGAVAELSTIIAPTRPRARPVAGLPPAEATSAAAPAAPLAMTAPMPGDGLRPRPRPTALALPVLTPAPAQVAALAPLRPRPRPFAPVPAAAPMAPPATVVVVLRPMPRPAGLAAALAAPDPAPVAQASAVPAPQAERRGGLFGALFGSKPAKPRDSGPVAGSVCGDPAIRGEDIARISSKVRGCGIEEPVRVTMVNGIRLNSPATIDCNTARALRTWVDEGLRPAFRGKEIVELRIAASYICRPRNNVRGAKISEHGRGKAVDVAGIVFSDGSAISVAEDYGPALRRAHKAACGIFGTTLGPGSDGYHEDHLHFDTASNRRPYCR